MADCVCLPAVHVGHDAVPLLLILDHLFNLLLKGLVSAFEDPRILECYERACTFCRRGLVLDLRVPDRGRNERVTCGLFMMIGRVTEIFLLVNLAAVPLLLL